MRYLAAKTFIAGSLIACAPLASAEISANVTLTSDYVFRGISQTDEDPAIQGGFDFAHATGFYLGTWGSSVNFGEDDPAHLELDVYAGLAGELGAGIGWDVGFLRYLYPGAPSALDYDFNEVYAGLSYGAFALQYAFSDNFFADAGRAHHLEGTAEFALPQGFTLGLLVGRQMFRDNERADFPDYTHWAVSVSTLLAGIDVALGYTDTNVSSADCPDVCDGRVVFSIAKSL
jgi:uncharacterized protein (TIGR02001 family)